MTLKDIKDWDGGSYEVAIFVGENFNVEESLEDVELNHFRNAPTLHSAATAEAQRQKQSADELCFEQSQAHRRLRALLDELGIPMIDLLGDFRSAFREEGAVVFREDGHWGPVGHTIAAGTVFEELRRLGFLASGSPSPTVR